MEKRWRVEGLLVFLFLGKRGGKGCSSVRLKIFEKPHFKGGKGKKKNKKKTRGEEKTGSPKGGDRGG